MLVVAMLARCARQNSSLGTGASSIAGRIRDELAECNTGYVLKPRDVSATLPGRDEDAPLSP